MVTKCKPPAQRRGDLIYRGMSEFRRFRKALVSKEPTGGVWEFEMWWLSIG